MNFNIQSPDDFEPHYPDAEPIDYEDSLFKDMADDIKRSQDKTTEKLNAFIEESTKADTFNKKVAVATLVVAVLTLIATIAGIILTLVQVL